MNGNSIALDTTIAIGILNGRNGLDRWIRRYEGFFLPVPVIGELRYGALNSTRATKNLEQIEVLASRCELLPVELRTAEIYADLRVRLKRAGRPIPENDLWIAAICVENDLVLATDDRHFSLIEGLKVRQP